MMRAASDAEPVSRILYGVAAADGHSSRPVILIGSSDLPGSLAHRADTRGKRLTPSSIPSLFGLAPCGVCHASRITARPVRSYRTFSPLPNVEHLRLCGLAPALPSRPPKATACTVHLCAAVYFLWHFPSSHFSAAPKRDTEAPSRTLSGTLLCGVRTFLSLDRAARETRRPRARQRPSGSTSAIHIIR